MMKKREFVSDSGQVLLVLLIILLLLLVFLVMTSMVFERILSKQQDLHAFESTFHESEYYRVMQRYAEMRRSGAELSSLYRSLINRPFVEKMQIAEPEFESIVSQMSGKVEKYLRLVEEGAAVPTSLTDAVRSDFDRLTSYLYRHESNQVFTLQMVNIFIILSFCLIAVVTIYVDMRRVREQRLKEGLRTLNRKNLQEMERGRKLISYAIHDNVLQDLEMMRFGLEGLSGEDLGTKLNTEVHRLRSTLADSIQRLREILEGLPVWDTTSFTFENNIRELIQRIGKSMEAEVRVKTIGLEKANISSYEMEQLLSILQELLFNVAKHAEAEQVVVKALWAKPQFRLVVEDDGVGFNPRRLFHEAETHIGFLSVQERAQAIGAEFTLKSSPGKGTSAVLQLDKGGEDE